LLTIFYDSEKLFVQELMMMIQYSCILSINLRVVDVVQKLSRVQKLYLVTELAF